MKNPSGIWDGSKNVAPRLFVPPSSVAQILVKDEIRHTSSPPRSIFPLAKPPPVIKTQSFYTHISTKQNQNQVHSHCSRRL